MENNDYNKPELDQDTLIEEPWSHQFEKEDEHTTRAARHTTTKESGLYSKIIFAVFGLIVVVIGVWALLKGFNLVGGTSQQGSTTPAVPKLVLQSQTTTTTQSTVKSDEQSQSTSSVANGTSSSTQSSSRTATSSVVSSARSGQGTYTIVSGDSAYSISEAYGMSIAEFYALNGFTESTVLLPGQTVKVSSGSSTSGSSTTSSTTRPTTNTSVREYVIREGDSIYSIALAHGMTTSEFKQLNGLSDDSLLLPGAVVKVSAGQ